MEGCYETIRQSDERDESDVLEAGFPIASNGLAEVAMTPIDKGDMITDKANELSRKAEYASKRMRGSARGQDCAELTPMELERFAKILDEFREVLELESRRP